MCFLSFFLFLFFLLMIAITSSKSLYTSRGSSFCSYDRIVSTAKVYLRDNNTVYFSLSLMSPREALLPTKGIHFTEGFVLSLDKEEPLRCKVGFFCASCSFSFSFSFAFLSFLSLLLLPFGSKRILF